LARLAELKREDPTLATVSQSSATRMPPRTRKALTALAKLFKDSRKLGEREPEKGASLELPVTAEAR
jgi:hypothetical protein